MKTVVIKYAGGQQKTVVLGKDNTCVSAEPRGWGTSCKMLALKPDGYYHCDDCGLVFKKLVLKEEQDVVEIKCDCKHLVNFLEWYFNECFGYDCPADYYRCEQCKRVYEAPHYSREAPLRFQESEAARGHVKRYREFNLKERKEKIRSAEEQIQELKTDLNDLPKSERKRLLKELRS